MSSSEDESIPEPQHQNVTTDGQNENDAPSMNEFDIAVSSVNVIQPSDIKIKGMQK